MRDEKVMTEGPLWPNIFRFSLPLAATGILQQLFNAADTMVVGRFVGKEAMAAVGSNAPLINILVTLFVGISLGTNVVMAQYYGSGETGKAQDTVHTSVLVGVIGGFAVALIGELAARPVLGVLSVPDDVIGMSETYLRIYLLGLPVILLYNFEAAIARSRGDTKTPLICLAVSGVVNVGLNLFFVCIVGMAASGVALATVIANVLSSAMMFIFLRKGPEATRIYISKLRIHKAVLKKILYIGVPSGVQGMVFSLSNIIVQSGINSLGSTIMAASSAAFNIEAMAYFVINSFGQACMTYTGQNYGAGKSDRCRKVLKTCFLEDIMMTVAACGLILLLGRQMLALFNTDPDVINNGYLRLLIIFSSYIFTLVNENVSGYMRGFGISVAPALTAVVCICVTRIFWMMFIFPARPEFSTILFVYPVSLALNAAAVGLACLLLHPSKRKYE